ncbi:MAG TPA: hypothetical protein VMM36_07375, partial [Opitutaceae bacterium]|nr:hypothetical protein [Opitutaceae bacterium]
LGCILAVAGSAVGLGNVLRVPGLAAQYGGGAFMVAYFVSLLIIGIPICWTEWTLGRLGGRYGFHSTSGIFHVLIRSKWGKFLGVIGFIVPVMIYMYYVYIEAWCLGYALNSLTGNLGPGTDFRAFFGNFTGAASDGVAINFGLDDVGIFVVIVYVMNFYFIYRGISKGIEMVCKIAMPALIAIAIIILIRVLTLGTPDAAKPEQSVANGLGFMWNPSKPVVERLVEGRWTAVETIASPNMLDGVKARMATDGTERITETTVLQNLKNPLLWLAAAGQIFFSLSVGFGVIITYASYLRRKDDIVLSGLTASAANEFCEVGLGGLITVPAAFVFLGAAGIVGQGTFGLGFNVLPEVFARMPFGQVFASIFFILLFLAAITSSLSMLQPGIAFLEEGLGIKRKASVALLGFVTAIGTMFVWYFSKDLKALDTIDFWVGTLMLFVQATILIIIFGWVVGIEKGWQEAHQGAQIRIPSFFKPVIKYVTPAFLLTIFVMFILQNVVGWNFEFGAGAVFQPTGYVQDLVGDNPSPVARLAFGFIVIMTIFTFLLVGIAGRIWEKEPLVEGKD